jgi:hypothetical protein
MKKVLFILSLLLVGVVLHSNPIINYLDSFNLETKYELKEDTLYFYDYNSRTKSEMLFNLSFAYTAIEFFLEDFKSDLNLEKIHYIYIIKDADIVAEVSFSRNWILDYLDSNSKEKQELLKVKINELIVSLERKLKYIEQHQTLQYRKY